MEDLFAARGARFSIAGPAGPDLPGTTRIGLGLLWVSALLTLYTGWDYFTAGVKHLVDADEKP